jgi:hypothetical protein
VKLQNAMIKQGGEKGEKVNFGKMELTAEDRELLNKMIDEKNDEYGGEYNNEDEKYQA